MSSALHAFAAISPPRRTRLSLTMLASVLALHALVFGLLNRSTTRWRQDDAVAAPSRANVLLRLLPSRPETRPELPVAPNDSTKPGDRPRGPVPSPVAPRRGTASTPHPAARDEAPASTEPGRPLASDRNAGQPLGALPPAPPASDPPLDLRWRPEAPNGRLRHPALDDPRAASARRSAGERMAGTLGTDERIVEQPLNDGARRLCRGDDCVVATPSRVQQLFPFDDQAQRAPRLIGR